MMLDLAEHAPSPEDILIAKQDSEALDRAIDKLQPRRCLALRLYYGLHAEPHIGRQIAERFGVGPARVHQLIHRAERELLWPMRKVHPERWDIMEVRRKKLFGKEPWPENWKDAVRDREFSLEHRDARIYNLRTHTVLEQANSHVEAYLGYWMADHDAHVVDYYEQRAQALYREHRQAWTLGPFELPPLSPRPLWPTSIAPMVAYIR